jgi:hypothetical protein
MRPIIGSHHSIADNAHLWHFARTSPRGSAPFKKTPQRSILALCAAVLAGLLAGGLACLVGYWLF